MTNWGKSGSHPDLGKYLTDVFVETGTFRGGGIRAAVAAGFPEVWSIEYDWELVKAVRENVVSKLKHQNVHVGAGDSGELLGPLLRFIDPEKRVTFWLDAHYHSGHGNPDYVCPLLAELHAIQISWCRNGIILIDDVRVLPRWRLSVELVEAAVLRINPRYVFERALGHVEGDVLVARVP